MIKFSGEFPWNKFTINIDGKLLYLGNRNNYDQNAHCNIVFSSYTTEDELIKNAPRDNEVFCIGDYNSYLSDRAFNKNLFQISTYVFHSYELFENNDIVNENIIYDAIIVSRNEEDKRRILLEKLTDYNLVSASAWPQGNYKHDPQNINFVLQGNFSQKELSDLYRSSKCSFQLSSREGECRSVLESLLCGCPVISTKPKPWTHNKMPSIGGRAEVLTPKNSLYCDWDSQSVLDTYNKFILKINDFNRKEIRSDALEFIFRERLKFIKLMHNTVMNNFNVEFKEVIKELPKDGFFYKCFKDAIEYYIELL